ncbi:hypothetical protein IMG5_151200, partial [Ichthyophthirius multifiliis]
IMNKNCFYKYLFSLINITRKQFQNNNYNNNNNKQQQQQQQQQFKLLQLYQ